MVRVFAWSFSTVCRPKSHSVTYPKNFFIFNDSKLESFDRDEDEHFLAEKTPFLSETTKAPIFILTFYTENSIQNVQKN